MSRYYVQVTYKSGEVKLFEVSRQFYLGLSSAIQDWASVVKADRYAEKRFGRDWVEIKAISRMKAEELVGHRLW